MAIGLRFNRVLFEPADFERCAIEPVAGNAKRQSEYLAGRLCARKALHELTGEAFVPARGGSGMPLWPEDITGAITHSHGRAAAIVASRQQWRGLGMDLEPVLSSERALRLAPSILTADEQAHFADLTSAKQQSLYVTLSFSLKESLFKALYPLCLTRFYFQDARLLDYAAGKASLRLLRDLPGFPLGSILDGHFLWQEDFVLAWLAIPTEAA